uniref:Uncharacterized protein n=1 Tax=Arundo donax TaxID=35708 RepID=A0A0A9BJP6_ARUDO
MDLKNVEWSFFLCLPILIIFK